jgi:hypothetical protein
MAAEMAGDDPSIGVVSAPGTRTDIHGYFFYLEKFLKGLRICNAA